MACTAVSMSGMNATASSLVDVVTDNTEVKQAEEANVDSLHSQHKAVSIVTLLA